MNKYSVKLSSKAVKDIKQIIKYIKKELKEPIIAAKYAELFIKETSELEHFPERHPIIPEDEVKFKNVRRLPVKNYNVFYRINEDNKIVTVERVLYGSYNWKEKL